MHSHKVSMSNFNSLIRTVAAAAAFLAGAAMAQAPANDTCAGAEVITLGTGRTTILQGVVHLCVFAAFLFYAIVP